MAWTDAGSRGYELLIEDGKLSVGLIHFWPGNAIGIRTRDAAPARPVGPRAITYDGSSRAAGLSLYVDGRRADCEVVRDQLTKNITGGGQRRADRRPAVPRPRVQERPGRRDRGLRPRADAARGRPALRRQDAGRGARPRPVGRSPPTQRQDLFAYYLANFDAEYRDAAGGAQGAAQAAERPGRPGGRDHGDEGAAAAPADVRPQARGVRRARRAGRARARRRPCCRSRPTGRATGSAWPGG